MNKMEDATAARLEGRFEEAKTILARLLESEKVVAEPSVHALIRSELGFTSGRTGDYRGAGRALTSAVAVAEKAGVHSELVAYWRDSARAFSLFADYHAGRASLIPMPDEPPRPGSLDPYHRMNRALLSCHQEEKWGEVAVELAALLEIAQSRRDVRFEVVVRANLGAALSWTDEVANEEPGIDHLRRAIDLADSNQLHLEMVQARKALAGVYYMKKRYPEAIGIVKEGCACIDEILHSNEDTTSRQELIAQNLLLFELSISINSNTESNTEVPVRLLWIAEQVRARNLARWFRIQDWCRQIMGKDHDNALISGCLKGLLTSEVEMEARHLTHQLDGARMTHLQGTREHARHMLDHLGSEQGRAVFDWQQYFHREDPAILTRAVEEVLSPGVALVSLFSTYEGVCPLILYRSGIELRSQSWLCRWSREKRVSAALALGARDQIEDQQRSFDWSARHLVPETSPRLRTPDQDEFWSHLLLPIAEHLRSAQVQKLIVIPHRELALIPYWRLVDSCDSVESLVLAPSFEVLRSCLGRQRPDRGTTLLVGDLTSTLPHAAREVGLVKDVRTGDRVVESISNHAEFLRGASGCSLLHVAGHGTFNPKNPYESGFPVAPSDGSQGFFARYTPLNAFEPGPVPRPGYLRLMTVASCMAELRLDACRLAVLSTCESGIPRQHGGGESLGLPNALLLAGAKSVIASLWKVHDGATYLLMKYFYEIWEGGTGKQSSPPRALLEARRRLRSTTRDQAVAILGSVTSLPEEEHPFAAPLYSDAFYCSGSW
jgi:CHAT domain-containing protein